MNKPVVRFALCAMLFALCPSAEAQQSKKEAERVAKILGVTIHFAEMQVRNDKALED